MQQMCRDWIIGFFLIMYSLQDLRKKQISEKGLIGFGIIGMIYAVVCKNHLFSILIGILPGCILLLFGRMTKQAIGYGDGILLLFMGLFLSGRDILALLGMALCLSSFFVVLLFFIGKLKKRMTLPFVPFLGISWVIIRLYMKGETGVG